MCPPSAQNKKTKTLKKRSEFLKTYKGIQVRKEFLALYCCRNDVGRLRLGITVPKVTGTAVVRNKLKRWIKEEFRHVDGQGLDFHFVVKSKFKTKEDYKNLSFARVKKEVNDAIKYALKNS